MTEPSRPGPLLDPRQATALRDELSEAIRAHSHWPDLWNLRGLLAAHEGDLQRANDAFREAIRRHRDYLSAYTNLAWVESLQHRPGRTLPVETPPAARAALGFVRNVIARVEPGTDWNADHGGLAFLVLLHAASNSDHEVIDSAHERLTSLLPGANRLLEAAGWMESGHLVTHVLRGLSHPERLQPGYSDLLLRAARLERAAGREDEATRLHAMAALYRGDIALYLVELGESASRRGLADRALELLREAVAANPDWHRTHQAIGYELSLRGIVGESLHHLAEAVRLEPRFPDVLYQWGLLLHAAGMNGEAMDAMGRALSANPRWVVARIALANLLFEADRAAEAAPHYEHVLDEGIETASLAGRLGYSLHAAGDRNRAEELFLEAIARHRDRPELLAYYGRFLMETDRHLEARAVWDRAIAANPPPRLRAELESLRDRVPTDRQGEPHD